ncbi:fasciclin domain-containing protein [Albibacterium profundi]|uniref:Fasciclin domain-containing protein n=1 Tax=Albibacterium profundi TaxID=3134906 RepID=A0ABV5CEJ7_9SPHI
MKRLKPKVCLSLIALFLIASSCNTVFDDHYHPENKLNLNIIQVLEEDPEFSHFVALIDKADLRKTLGEAAIYTCLAPNNEFVENYFLDEKGYSSMDQVPVEDAKVYINYHFINGMYYMYDFEKNYRNIVSPISKSRRTNYKTRSEGNNPGKNIRIFSSAFFAEQGSDYTALFGEFDNNADFRIEGADISERRDIGARNGVIHVLATPLSPMARTDEALAADPETSIFSSWIERHSQYILGEKDEFGYVDTTLYKTYSFGRNLADENIASTLFVPTNEAIANYFEPYMDDIHNTLDSVPIHVMYSFIRSSIHSNFWYPSDLKRNDPEWSALTGYVSYGNDVLPTIQSITPASNSLLYKVNRIVESPDMNSVRSGIMMKYKKYRQWYWMLTNRNLGAGLTDGLYYQHSPKTLLVQSDEVWGTPLAEDMEVEAQELRLQECRAGVFNMDIREDGGFRKRFYPTDFGYILYEDGRFYDYTGHSVALLTPQPVWEKVNGTIYEIDGFLNPIDRLDNTITVYQKMLEDPQMSSFVAAVDKAGLAGELQLTGFFTYSIFAPSNVAMQAGGIQVDELSPEALRSFVNTYIVPSRYLFTDGVFNGRIANRNAQQLNMQGSWEMFTISKESQTASIEVANRQASNGVLHRINQIL